MSIEAYRQARSLLQAVGAGDFVGARSEELVKRAEHALGLSFAASYRAFLLELGCGNCGSFEVYGLIDGNFSSSSVPNGIWLTLRRREQIGLGVQFVVIGDVGDGTAIAIDSSQLLPDGEAAVVRLSLRGEVIERLADSFGDYFLEGVQAALR